MHPIYALWSHPRSMSTAMERVMRERGDLDCAHEPFMYDYYVHRQVLARLTNCFLIRNPVASILSYHKLDPEVTLEEIGLEAQWRHYRGLVARGETPVVIEAEAVRQDTRATLRAMWGRIGLPQSEQAFDWQDEVPQDWQQVQGWHGDASQSKGIRPLTQAELDEQAANFATAARAAPRLQEALDHHLPYYEKLRAVALAPA